MPPRSHSYSSVYNVSYDDQYSETDADPFTKPIYTSATLPLEKSVCFSNKVKIFFVERLEDYTADEVASIWYDKYDFEKMKNEMMVIVHLMETSALLPSQKASTRGLEHRTREGAWSKFQNKRNAYCAVLDEQDSQWKNIINDPDAIAQVYLEHTTLCQVAAIRIGRQDAIAARKIHRFSPINKYSPSTTKIENIHI